MKVAFLTEMGFNGKIPLNYPNMRTEFAWMYALEADHYNIQQNDIKGYDIIFIILPKGKVYLNAYGVKLTNDENPISNLLNSNLIEKLKIDNKKVYYIQEGPHWLFNDYELVDQINFYNTLLSCDGIFAHNVEDVKYYKGLFPNKTVNVIPTLMIEETVKKIIPQPKDKVIIGGNLARWYGGFESYIIAQEFNLPIWTQTSHAKRENEDELLNHLPRVFWTDWMKQLSNFKYAIHLMPTVAAGTFSLNCAYFGIPCIGNKNVDTQRLCHPDLSIEVHDLEKAKFLAKKLKTDFDFYTKCSETAKLNYKTNYSLESFKNKIFDILNKHE